jgi:hypothetical protein
MTDRPRMIALKIEKHCVAKNNTNNKGEVGTILPTKIFQKQKNQIDVLSLSAHHTYVVDTEN